MNYSKEYELGWGVLAEQHHLNKRTYGNGMIYDFPSSWQNGWISEMHPTNGLSVASAWFTPEKTITYTLNVYEPCMWIFCIDCGDIICTQQGKPAKQLTPINHVIINPQKQFRITFPKNVHTCFTCVLVFEEFIQAFLQGRKEMPKISIESAKLWKTQHYNSPDIMLILEQIRWGVRHSDTPLITFECKTIELLASIARNFPELPERRQKRQNYVTWENEQKIYRVKNALDKDILNPPSIKTMCQLSEMSESKLRLSFKQIYSVPIYDYIRTETMKRAMQLLSADHLSIQNIAVQCGYKNSSKFTEAFKDVHGITPSQFRKSFYL